MRIVSKGERHGKAMSMHHHDDMLRAVGTKCRAFKFRMLLGLQRKITGLPHGGSQDIVGVATKKQKPGGMKRYTV